MAPFITYPRSFQVFEYNNFLNTKYNNLRKTFSTLKLIENLTACDSVRLLASSPPRG